MSLKTRLRFPNTLAFRLTCWYAGMFGVTSCVAFVLFYMLVTSVIRERTDQELLAHASEFSTVLAARGLGAVENLAVLEAQAAGVRKVFFRLLYPTGQAVASSNMEYWRDIGVSQQAIVTLLRTGASVFETVVVPDRKDNIRILYAMIGRGVILQVGQSTEPYTRITDAFRKIFIATMIGLVGLAVGIGWFMARRALSGVEAVTHTARQISEGSLEKRVPVRERGDEIDRLATTFNEMLDRLQRLVTEIREMSDNIAHDLKSPITRIRGMAEVTLTTDRSLAAYESMAGSTIEECDRLLDMINTMLMISKTESGVEKPRRELIDMARLVKEACELFEPSAEEKGLRLDCHTPSTCLFPADARLIQRMLSNLIDNAIKYTAAGSVHVSLEEDKGGAINLTVTDTGIGMAPEDLPRIFHRFYRGDQSRSLPGVGLGLSLARAIARAHDGEITVKSVVGKGSTFTVTLPRRPTTA